MSIKRGLLIVFEGCDRVGKTTQINKLFEWFNTSNLSVNLYKFPNRDSVTGKIIDEYLHSNQKLDNHVVHLLFSANRWEFSQKIIDSLYLGNNVLLDRYVYSGIAYSAAKPNISFDWCKNPDVGLPKPDLIFYLTLDSKKVCQREGYGEEIYEKESYQKKVKQNYSLLIQEDWNVIDCDRSIEEIHEEIKTIVNKKLNENKKEKLDFLASNFK